MKNYTTYTFALLLCLLITSVNAQTINWASLDKETRHIVNANIGTEHGLIYGLGYGYQINTRLFPVIINAEYSFPSGHNLIDDFKTKIGGQVRWIAYHNFQFSTKTQSIFRRYENQMVRMVNFGSDMSAVAGYYRKHWFLAGEFGFDKAIVTHFKHSNIFKRQFEDVFDGWYEPSTGGNFYYGMQGGCSLGNHDIYIKAGKMIEQGLKLKPTLPFYAQLGYTIKL